MSEKQVQRQGVSAFRHELERRRGAQLCTPLFIGRPSPPDPGSNRDEGADETSKVDLIYLDSGDPTCITLTHLFQRDNGSILRRQVDVKKLAAVLSMYSLRFETAICCMIGGWEVITGIILECS